MWTSLDNTMCGEISQKEEGKYCRVSLIVGSKNNANTYHIQYMYIYKTEADSET